MHSNTDNLLLPEEFYYSQDSSRVRYSNKPSGQIEINRIIKGQTDCFISGAGSRARNPKKMLLADWTAASWNADKIAEVQRQLSALIAQGFSVYLWQAGKILRLESGNLDCLESRSIRDNIKPELPEVIIHAGISQEKLTRDNSFLLDNYWLERLTQPEKVNLPRRLKVSDFAALEESDQKKLPDILAKASPKLSSVVFDILSKQTIDVEALLKKQFPHIPFEENIKKIDVDFDFATCDKQFSDFSNVKSLIIGNSQEISADHLTQLFNQIPKLEEFCNQENIYNRPLSRLAFIPVKNFSHLKKVDVLSSRASASELQGLLQSEALEEIRFAYCGISCKGMFEFLSTAEKKHSKLKSISLRNCEISNRDFAAIIQETALKELTLGYCKIEGDSIETAILAPENLRKLDIRGALPPEYLALLTSAPNLEALFLTRQSIPLLEKNRVDHANRRFQFLKEISFDECKALKSDFAILLQSDLSNLKKIVIRNSDICLDALGLLLQASRHLQEIELTDSSFSGDASAFSSRLLPGIRKITLNGRMSTREFHAFIQAFPDIEEIILKNCRLYNPDPGLSKIILPKLRKIDISQGYSDPSTLVSLLYASSLVEEINLQQYGSISDVSVVSDRFLPCLWKIDLSRASKMNENGLCELLKNAIRLEELNLSHTEIVSDNSLALSNLGLHALKKINLTDTHIQARTLMALLQSCPCLEEIILDSAVVVGENQDCPNVFLKKLKRLDLNYNKISIPILKALLEGVPALKRLNIQVFQLSGDASLLSGITLPALTEINVSYSNIEFNSLAAVLQTAPNLEVIDLSNCYEFSGDLPAHLSLSNMKKIDLSGSCIKENHLRELLKISPDLEEINLAAYSHWSSSLFAGIRLTRLKKIDLPKYLRHAKIVMDLPKACPNLEEITIPKSLMTISDQQKKPFLKVFRQILTLPALKEKNRKNLHALCEILAKKAASGNPFFYDYKRLGKISHQYQFRENFSGDKNFPDANTNNREAMPESLIANSLPAKKLDGQSIERSLDADTRHKKVKFDLQRFFYSLDGRQDPAPNDYRLAAFNIFRASTSPCKLSEAFQMASDSNARFKPCVSERMMQDVFQAGKVLAQEARVFYGKRQFHLSEAWQVIPSLAAGETLMKFHTDPPEASIDIQYSERDNLYYIKSIAGQQTISLDFLVKIPKKTAILPKDIQAMVEEYHSWGSGALEPQSANPSGKDYLAWMRAQKKGACRHRAFTFAEGMQTAHPEIPVRIVTNDCHAFAEIRIQGLWVACQLGGYSAELEIQETYAPGLASGEEVPVTREALVYHPITDPACSKYDRLMQT